MATKTIETKAIISAQDRTGATFAQVAQKLKGMEAAAAQASRRMDAMTRGMSSAWQAQQRHADIARRMAMPTFIPQPGLWERTAGARARTAQAAVATGAAVLAQGPLIREVVRQASAQLHERIRMENAGMTPGEIADAHEQMARLSRVYKPIGQTEIMHMLRNMRSVVGSYEEAAHIAEPLMKLRVISQHASPHASAEEINENFDKLIKAAELGGVTQDLGKFTNYMQGIAKALNVFGDTIKPYQYFEAAQYGRSATMNLSPEFVAGVMPTLIQHHGGSQAGTALAAFYRALVGGRMSNVAVHELQNLGLLNMARGPDGKLKYISQTKTGDIKGILPGGVVGADLARTDPDKWVNQILVPALARKGITDPGRVAEVIAHMFSNQVAAQFVTEMITQRGLFEKDRAMTKGAKGLEAAGDIMAKDLDQAFKGLRHQIDALAAAAGKPLLEPLTRNINSFADTIGGVAERLSHDQITAKHAFGGALVAGGAASYLGLAAVGGLFGGAGFMAAAAPTALVAAALGTGLYAHWAYEKMAEHAKRVDAIFADRSGPIDRSPAALARTVELNRMSRARSSNWLSGFTTRRGAGWARGDEAAGVAPGGLAFGFGAFGVNDNAPGQAALRRPPPNASAQARGAESARVNDLLNALREHTKVDIDVKAEPMKIEVTASGELISLVGDAKQAVRESKMQVRANSSGPGSTGSTDFGNQH